MEKIRLLIADDHPGFREGISRFIDDEEDLEVVAVAGDGEKAVRLATELKPDVIIMDIAMPDTNGIEAARRIKVSTPATAIIMVSGYGYEAYMRNSLQVGAAGFMLKNAPITKLISAIRLVHAGESVYDIELSRRIMSRLYQNGADDHKDSAELLPRELEVLKQAAKGKTNKEIAHDLTISQRTVQSHLANIFRKLSVGSRTEAVLHALKVGWLTPDDLP